MPYRSNRELPDAVRNALPEEAQSVFRRVFNATEGEVGEERAFKQAWGALENQGWKKRPDGKWHQTKKAHADPVPFQTRFELRKVDEEQGLVFGWASIAEDGAGLAVDDEGDVIEPAELEKGAYRFVKEARVASDSHRKETIGVGVLIESMFFSKEKQKLLGIEGLPVGWWVGFQVDDPKIRAQLREGQSDGDGGKSMLSIGGSGSAEEVAA